MSTKPLRGLMVGPLLLVASACGGTKHIADISPAVVERLSGSWSFNAQESDSVPDPMDRSRPEGLEPRGRPGADRGAPRGAPGGGGRMPGGGMPGGRGGMAPGGRGGGADGMNPEAMRALRRIAIMVPSRLDIQLADSAVTIAYGSDPQAHTLPFGEEVKRDLAGDLELKAEAKWEKERVVVTRSVNGGGSMTESFIPAADGRRLTVVVAIARGRGEPMEFRRVYDRTRPGTP